MKAFDTDVLTEILLELVPPARRVPLVHQVRQIQFEDFGGFPVRGAVEFLSRLEWNGGQAGEQKRRE